MSRFFQSRVASAVEVPGAARVPTEAEIRETLSRILEGAEFRASPRCQAFLRYVVEKTLAGQMESLKERTIGFEVFGRPADYDPSTDATVRVKASEVRKRLIAHHRGEGQHDLVRIELPVGGYVPTFTFVTPGDVAEEAAPRVGAGPRSRLVLGSAAALLLLVVVVWQVLAARDSRVLKRFWGPALASKKPVVLSVSYVPVYRLNDDNGAGKSRPPMVSDFLPLNQDFVGGGDLLATVHIQQALQQLGHETKIGLGEQISFNDIKSAPSVLVGYSLTRWRQLGQSTRFESDVSPDYFGIRDNRKATEWRIRPVPADRKPDVDYAIITRAFHPDTGNMLVVAAGLTQYGTDAASALITDEASLAEAVKCLPAGWETKSLQLVIQAKVISGEPGSPKVLACHAW